MAAVMKLIKFVIFSIIVLFLVLILLPLYLFFCTWKTIVKILVWIFKRNFTESVPLNDIYTILRPKDPDKKTLTWCMNGLLTVDGSVDIEILRSKIMTSIIMLKDKNGDYPYMRLRQVPVFWCGYPFYRLVDSFIIENHVKVVDNLDDSNIDEFLRTRMDAQFPIGNSYWEIIVGRNYNKETKSIIYVRCHHCLGDGFSLFKILETDIFQEEFIVQSQNPVAKESNVLTKEPFFEKLYNSTLGLLSKFYEEYNSIKALSKRKKAKAESIDTCYISTSKPFLMKALKESARTREVPLSALVNSAIFAGFADFMKKVYPEENLEYLTALCAMPIPGRPNKFCNHIGLTIVNFPLSNSDTTWLETACFYSKRMKEIPVFSIVLNFFGKLGYVLPVKLFDKLVLTHSLVGLSNIAGPKDPIHFMGYRVLNMKCWVTTYIDPWITFLTSSYNGELRVVNAGWSRILGTQENLNELTKTIERELDNLIGSV